jgi:carbon-monoxide dehydrogenase iron sulfur subunit
MKTVIVRPERCVGCLQCRLACAVEHSAGKNLYTAISEATRPKARLRIYPGNRNLAFPNKCRHCDPAPCQEVCIAGAIKKNAARGTVDIDPQRCISCAMCAMACPFGVLTYSPVHLAPDKAAVALKCDQCPDREKAGKAPACVTACKVGALTYGDWEGVQADKGRSIAQAFFATLQASEDTATPPLIRLWREKSRGL